MTDWRKAVELADGWWFMSGGDERLTNGLIAVRLSESSEPPTYIKDAIAAQLVRQVDAHEWAEFRGTWMTSEVKDERTGKRLAYVEYTGSTPPYDDCDRSELAVNAILDSGVLEYDYR